MSTATLKFTTVPVTSKYGWRVLKTSGLRNHHDGCDTANGSKYPHSAFGDGVVVESPQKSKHWMYGWYIRIRHAPGIETSHHSLDKRALFQVGDRVAMGQIVGYAGTSAMAASGNHVHNALWLNGQHVDPLKYLKPGVAVTISNTGKVASGNNSTPINNEEDDMFTEDDRAKVNGAYQALWYGGHYRDQNDVLRKFNYGVLPIVAESQKRQAVQAGQIAALSAAVSAISGGTPINLTAIEAAAEKGAREAFDGITFKAQA